MEKSVFDQWFDDNYTKLRHHAWYWKCKQSWLAAQKQQLDELTQLRAENAKLKAEVERLRSGFDKFLGSCEECTDQDGWLAFMCSAEDYHDAQSVLEKNDEQT